ncbi:hypothetical protein [Thalassoroseus pseudoceratinae]|uniref:hypothetical protein n=1 Tax=Thalassoroseus pseudoceratinae TaxID=2713176 RepID=UPI0014218F15|nr:hypothetical protein [Thalassoroseus pseudoceratinae]
MSTVTDVPNVINGQVDTLANQTSTVDFIEELRLRTWARKNYAISSERSANWHPVILDEMTRIDREQA